MPLRLSEADHERAKWLASQENVSLSELLRRIVEPAVRRRVVRARTEGEGDVARPKRA